MPQRCPSKHRNSASIWRGCFSKLARNPFSKRWLASVPDHSASSLAGKRIVITRAMTDSEELARELADRGAIPLVFPLISFSAPEDFGPLDEAIDRSEEHTSELQSHVNLV